MNDTKPYSVITSKLSKNMQKQDYSNGYWTEGKVVNGTNTGGGVFVKGTPSTTQVSYAGSPSNSVQKQSTTTLSSDKTSDISNAVTKISRLSNKGATTDPNTGVYTDASGRAISPPLEKEKSANTSSFDDQIDQNLNEMQRMQDAATADTIANIKQKFDQRRSEQKSITEKASKNLTNSLLMGGVTGKGSSAQFAPISSEGIITSNENYGLKKIADLDSQENDLIAEAKAAQLAGNFRILEKKNAEIEKKRAEKIETAKKLNEDIAKRNNEIRDAQIQNEKDTAVSQIYASGVTDVPTILENLKKSGITNVTAKEVADTLKNIVPPGISQLVKTLQDTGAPSSIIRSVLSSTDEMEAYDKVPSIYLQKASGDLGEAYAVQRDLLERGVAAPPLNDLLNQIANRRKTTTSTSTIPTPEGKEAIKKFNSTISAVSSMQKTVSGKQSTKAQMESLISDGDYDSAYMQVQNSVEETLTGTSKTSFADSRTDYEVMGGLEEAIRAYDQAGGNMNLLKGSEEEIKRKLGIDSGKASVLAVQLWREFQQYRLNMTGAAFSPEESKDYASVNPTLGKSLDLNLSVIQGARNQLKNRIDKTVDARVPKAKELRSFAEDQKLNTQIVKDEIVQTAEQAKSAVDQIFDTLPANIQDLITQYYEAGEDDLKVFQRLQAKGYIK